MNASTSYRADIDGLRAVAVLAVVGYHAFPGIVRSGFVGVDIFFIISGFLITRNIADGLAAERFSFADFYRRRIRRIFPALLIVLIAVYAIGWFELFTNEFRELGKHVAAGAGFVSNLALQAEAGYFDYTADAKPLLHLWSLGIEEQFYLAWPLLLWAIWKRINPIVVLSIVTTTSLAASLYASLYHPVAAFYFPLFRVWELACGGLLALAVPVPIGGSRTARNVMGAAGLAFIAIGVVFATNRDVFPGWWVMLPTGGAWLLIATGPDAICNRVLSLRPLVWIGLISYPLYLWHWPLLTFARILDGPLPSRLVRLTMVGLSLLLAWLTLRVVERPLRRADHGRMKVLALSAGMAAICAIGVATYAFDGLTFRRIARRAQPYVDSMVGAPRVKECFDILHGHERDKWYCELNPAAGTPAAFVFGDSHAPALLPAFERAAIERGRNLYFTGFSGCPPLLGITVNRGDLIYRNCPALNERVFRFVVDQKIRDLYLVGAWTYYTDGDYTGENYSMLVAGNTPLTLAGSRLAFEHGLDVTLSRYRDAGVRLHFVQKVPSQLHAATDLVRALVTTGPETVETIRVLSVPFQQHRQLMSYVSAAFAARQITADGRGAASLIDLDPAYCGEEACAFARPGVSFYMDNNHLTVAGAMLAAPILARHLSP
ncbi:MAG TPA: acyltransferase family protein [Vicinamibacterales bacterium]|nr:acyltransferase family protein [Vicinamibacterales bacterium]